MMRSDVKAGWSGNRVVFLAVLVLIAASGAAPGFARQEKDADVPRQAPVAGEAEQQADEAERQATGAPDGDLPDAGAAVSGQEPQPDAAASSAAGEIPGEEVGDRLPPPIVGRLLERVRVQQLEGGRYASGLDEILLELGLAYREAGERGLAADAFERAFYVARANYGLYDLGQIPYLEHLVEEYRALGNWDKVVDTYYMMYWVHRRQYGDNDPRLLPAIERITKVQASIATIGESKSFRSNFMSVRELLNRGVRIVETHYDESDPRLIEMLYRVAWTNYALVLQTGQIAQYRQVVSARRAGVTFVSDGASDPFVWIEQADRSGRRALDRIEEIFEAAYAEDPASYAYPLALVRIHQGDWELLFASGSGRRNYKEAFNLLAELENGEESIAGLFDEPKLLPARIVFAGLGEDRAPEPAEAPEGRVVEVAFDVYPNGRTDDFKMSGVPPELREEAQSLMQNLAFQRFRPRLEDGSPVKTRVTRRYLIDPNGDVVPLDRRYDLLDPRQTVAQEKEPGLSAGGFR